MRNGKGKTNEASLGGNNSNQKQKRKVDGSTQAEAVALAGQAKNKGKAKEKWVAKKKKDQSGNDILGQPCQIHTKKDEDNNLILPKHTTRQCRLLMQQFREGQSGDKSPDDTDDGDKAEAYLNVNATLMIFADVESKSRLKVINLEVNMAMPATTKFLNWSKTPITFDQSDHPAYNATPGQQALVVDPIVEGTRLRKVLMDGGSGLNILYEETMKGMGIPMSRLSESSMQFHGAIPGKKAKSLGQIALDVVFGDEKHFRKEKLTFDVVDFRSAYHAISACLCTFHGPSILRVSQAQDAWPERRNHCRWQ